MKFFRNHAELETSKLSTRTSNVLCNHGILTAQQLAAKTEAEIRCLAGIGRVAMAEIKDEMSRLGIQFSSAGDPEFDALQAAVSSAMTEVRFPPPRAVYETHPINPAMPHEAINFLTAMGLEFVTFVPVIPGEVGPLLRAIFRRHS